MALSLSPHEKIEDLQCGGLSIIVRDDGFHYGTDSVLLANYVKAGGGSEIVELCSGLGAVSILLSAKTRAARITGIEIQTSLVETANRSVELNRIGDRVNFIAGDICGIRDIMEAGSADVVVANPPYLRRGSGAESCDRGVAIARTELCCTISDVAAAAGWLLGRGGTFYVVHRPERLVDLFCAMRGAGVEPKEIRFCGASAGKPPPLVLVRGKKGASAGLRYMEQVF